MNESVRNTSHPDGLQKKFVTGITKGKITLRLEMMSFIAFHFIALIIPGMGYDNGPRCPDRYVDLQTGCYHFSERENITWCQAYFFCRNEMKGFLVEIESQQEQDNIKQHIITTADPKGKYGYWLGASDQLKEGEYRWMNSNNLMTFNEWDTKQLNNVPKEPNNLRGNENCAMIYILIEYAWNDLDCDELNYMPMKAICETKPIQ